MIRHRWAVAVASAALVLIACSPDDGAGTAESSPPTSAGPTTTTVPPPSAGCDADPAAPSGTTDRTLRSGGLERRFQLVVPEGYDGTTPLPVLFGLHALTVDYTFVPVSSGLTEIHDDYQFIGVFPSGVHDGPTPYWVAVPAADNRDVTFIADLLDLIEAELCVDTAHVFSTGQSNGGQMSSLLACLLDDRITAVAPVAGVEFARSCDGGPVPVMAFHGDADPVVTYEGGGLNATAIADQHYWKGDLPPGLPVHGGVDEALQNWAEHNGCDPDPAEEQVSPEVVRRSWNGCQAATVLYVVEGGGHTWPGWPVPGFEDRFGPTTTDIDATALMFEFFLGPRTG